MRTAIVRTERDLDELGEGWNALAQRSSASYFSTFDHARLAWTHLKRPDDQLLVLAFSEASAVVGIAPLFISRERRMGLPCRVIGFLTLREGDRPQILARADDELRIWRSALDVLCNQYRAWEILDLREQPVEGPGGGGWSLLQRRGLLWHQARDSVNYYVPLQGSWDDYLKAVSSNTRGDWRRKVRRLAEAHGGHEVECLSAPEQMPEGLERFVGVERSGWKRAPGAGLSKDEAHRRFYEDTVGRMASRQAVRFYFLRVEEGDIAGIINFAHGDVVYMKHTAYSSAYAKFSPGVILLAEVTRQLFGGPWREYDLLGMREDKAPQRYKAQWALGRRETLEWTGYRVPSRLAPWLAARGLYRRLRSFGSRGARPSGSPAGAPAEPPH